MSERERARVRKRNGERANNMFEHNSSNDIIAEEKNYSRLMFAKIYKKKGKPKTAKKQDDFDENCLNS